MKREILKQGHVLRESPCQFKFSSQWFNSSNHSAESYYSLKIIRYKEFQQNQPLNNFSFNNSVESTYYDL